MKSKEARVWVVTVPVGTKNLSWLMNRSFVSPVVAGTRKGAIRKAGYVCMDDWHRDRKFGRVKMMRATLTLD